MRKKKLTILIIILFFISPIVSFICMTPNNFLLRNNNIKEDSIKNKVEIPKSSNGNEWILDGTSICTALNNQNEPQIVDDGLGGAIITWYDYRSGNGAIYAQKVDSNGMSQWALDGVAICTYSTNSYSPQICSDGAGGAIITWYDYRFGYSDIFAQLVDSNGISQWTPNGTAICTANRYQDSPRISSDGAGGAIITWNDYRTGTQPDIYAQKINSGGITQWTANGTVLCNAIDNQYGAEVCNDGAGGAIITWYDRRSGSYTDVYAQKINSVGITQWTLNGTAISTAVLYQDQPKICSDGAGGAIIAWEDSRTGYRDIYAQRINSGGSNLWGVDGKVICSETNEQQNPEICSDGTGGAFISWNDWRSGSNYDLYAQKIDSIGNIQWDSNGLVISNAVNSQYSPQIITDGSGGMIITWKDTRNTEYEGDIYVQKIDVNGEAEWKEDGLAICTENNNQESPQICSDGYGNAIITWVDERNGPDDIYALRVLNATADTKIVIDSPEAKVYTEPMSSYYPATFGFEADELGEYPDGWSVDESGGTVQVISSHSGHSNVIELHETSDDFTEVYTDVSNRSYGTVEWWVSVNRDDDWFELGIYDGDSDNGIHMSFANDGYLKYHDGSIWTVIMPYSTDVWYHFKVEWEFSTDWHLWINGTSQDESIGYPYRNAPSNLDRIRFQISNAGGHQDQYMYIDAVGYSWDSNYEVGYNWDEGFFLGLNINNTIYHLGYSLDNANESISGNTTIPLPIDGPHRLCVYGTTFFREYVGSETLTFIVDTKAPQIVINRPRPSHTAGTKPPYFMISVIEANVVSKWYTIDSGANNFPFEGLHGLINNDAWRAASLGSVTLRIYVEDSAGNITFDEVTIIKELEVPATLIFNIVIISMFSVIGVLMVFIFRELRIPRER